MSVQISTPNGSNSTRLPIPTPLSARIITPTAASLPKKPNNYTKVRNYLFNLAHNNIQKLGKKVENVSVHLIDKHISNEFKKIEDSVA